MVSNQKDLVTKGRRAWARFLRLQSTILILPICAGILFTTITLNWAISTITSIREETKRSIYQDLKLADSQINSVVNLEVDRVREAAQNYGDGNIRPNPEIQIWLFDNSQNTLSRSGTSQKLAVGSKVEKTRTDFSETDTIITAWRRIADLGKNTFDLHEAQKLGNLEVFGANRQLGFSYPIINNNGQLSGLAFLSKPSSLIEQYLPSNTLLVDPVTSSLIQQGAPELSDLAKDKLFRGELVPNELFSAAKKLQHPMAFSGWRIWSDHPIAEVWNRPEVRRALNFSTTLVVLAWVVVYFIVQSGRNVRNRQRHLIGSLVRKVIWITDETGQIDCVLGKITSHLGWKEVDYQNVDIRLFLHPDDRETLTLAIQKARAVALKDEIIEVRFENKDREYRWYEVTVTNMMDVPEINGVIISAHDIEQRKHATDHILASKRAAEKANEAKSEFLSRMSHELRTPLNAILGFGQLLEMEAISDRQAENVGQILIAGRHLLNLVNDILDIARIETRKVNLSVEKVNIREVVEESFALLGPLATKSNITLEITNADCPDVWSDRQRLKQVILNLTSNGIKYNREGGKVCVSCNVSEDGLKLEVTDNGIGIESHYLDRVFTPFDRLGSDNSQVEGSGLGLALSKTLVEAMGATLEVRSVHGTGSTFTLWFKPNSIVSPESDGTESLEFLHIGNANDFRILLIEDNVVNLRYVSKVVEKMPGVALMSAKEGGIGIEMARNHNPDLILLDLDLPDLHGRDVLASLRSDEKTRNKRIFVMSAETNPHIVEEVLILGADQFVTKPVDVNSLVSIFSEERNAA